MSWFGSSNNTNTNNNNNNNNNSGWNFGSNNNNNTNANATNNSFNWNGNNNANNNNNNNMNNANNRQAQFVTKQTRFQSLPDDKKKSFMEFENNIILATSNKKQELDGTIKKLEQLPDIEHSLEMYAASTALLLEKLASYRHELEPFTTKLKKEFVYASQVQVDVQRQQSVHSSQIQHLPPPFYWDKINQFQQQLTDLRKQLENLQQHLLDTINNSQQTQVINTKSVTNALNAAHRSTLNIASQVIANHNVLQKLKEEYKKFRLQQFGDSHDPFHDTTPKKTSSVSTIQQYVNRGLELNGLQEISTNFGSNANQNQNQSNNFGQNTSSFSWGSNNNNSNNNNQNSNANNNQNNNNNSSAWNWGSNTNTNNNNNNSSSSSSSNNNANSSGFNWGSSNNSNNSNGNNNSSFSFGNNANNSNNSNNNTSGFSWGNTTNNSNNNSNASNAWTSNLQFRSNSFAA